MLRRKFELFCLLCWETMRKMLWLHSFDFHRIPYKLKIIKKLNLSQNSQTYRADSPSDKDSKTILGDLCPNFQEGTAEKSGKMDQNTGNLFIMHT